MRLDDGTVIPSYMGVSDTSGAANDAVGFFDEVSVLVGEVVAIHYRDDPNNQSRRFTEYTVMVWRSSGNGVTERLPYRCSQAESFGSMADFHRFSFRAATKAEAHEALNNGATVLVACLNGDRSSAYIIGAIPHPKRTELDPPRAAGRYSVSRFNGVEFRVNDDGSFELKVPGATTADGAPDPKRDAANHGSHVTFAANGDIIVDQGRSTLLGSKTSDENLVLGNRLVAALAELSDVFAKVGIVSEFGNLGAPVPVAQVLVDALLEWKTKYLTSASPAPILAEHVFTER